MLLHSSGILYNTDSMITFVLLHFKHKNDVTIIIRLYRATHLRLVALSKSSIMIVASFLWSKCSGTQVLMEFNQAIVELLPYQQKLLENERTNSNGSHNCVPQ